MRYITTIFLFIKSVSPLYEESIAYILTLYKMHNYTALLDPMLSADYQFQISGKIAENYTRETVSVEFLFFYICFFTIFFCIIRYHQARSASHSNHVATPLYRDEKIYVVREFNCISNIQIYSYINYESYILTRAIAING